MSAEQPFQSRQYSIEELIQVKQQYSNKIIRIKGINGIGIGILESLSEDTEKQIGLRILLNKPLTKRAEYRVSRLLPKDILSKKAA